MRGKKQNKTKLLLSPYLALNTLKKKKRQRKKFNKKSKLKIKKRKNVKNT